MTQDGELLFAEDVARLTGIKLGTVKAYAARRKRLERAGRVTPWDMPAPLPERGLREVHTAAGLRRVRAQQWRRADIVAWREIMFDRPPPERARDDAGRLLPKPDRVAS
jgi:hypothetical protein